MNRTYVALLRGINVGGNNIVSMTDLKSCFEDLGFEKVVTYINSGNVIFKTGRMNCQRLETQIERVLQKTFSIPIRVVVRSFEDIENLIRHIPKNWTTKKDKKCNVIFLRRTVDHPSILDGLEPKPGIEEVHYHPGVLFWSAKMSDITRSSMIKLSAKPVYQDMTVRIANTTRKLYEIMRAF